MATSELEFRRELNQPGRRGAHHLPEQRIVEVAIHRRRSEKLRVVEEVEGFHAELQRLGLSKCYVSLHDQIRVEHARSREKSPPSIAHGAESVRFECAGIEVKQIRIVRIADVQGLAG